MTFYIMELRKDPNGGLRTQHPGASYLSGWQRGGAVGVTARPSGGVATSLRSLCTSHTCFTTKYGSSDQGKPPARQFSALALRRGASGQSRADWAEVHLVLL